MKKNTGMKRITIVILVIAAISLVFGSFIMLLGQQKAGEPHIPTAVSSSSGEVTTWTSAE